MFYQVIKDKIIYNKYYRENILVILTYSYYMMKVINKDEDRVMAIVEPKEYFIPPLPHKEKKIDVRGEKYSVLWTRKDINENETTIAVTEA